MTFGGIILLAVVVALFVIGAKVRQHSRKFEELEKAAQGETTTVAEVGTDAS